MCGSNQFRPRRPPSEDEKDITVLRYVVDEYGMVADDGAVGQSEVQEGTMHWMLVHDSARPRVNEVPNIGAMWEFGRVRLGRQKIDPKGPVESRKHIRIVESLGHTEILARHMQRHGS